MKYYENYSSKEPGSAEQHEKGKDVFNKLTKAINAITAKIKSVTGAKGPELTHLTSDALVYIANETIHYADEDGKRTTEEQQDITTSVEEVLTEGVMEKVELKDNPILKLDAVAPQDVTASVQDLNEKHVNLPNGESIAVASVAIIEENQPRFEKISDRQGSNDGGWFEDKNTGERFYIKFYANPDQGKVEYIANTIYQKLGINTVQSKLLNLDGRPAIASKEITGAMASGRDEQAASPEVRNGFLADAYLANWDVVGLAYDNIVHSKDGMCRVDNGGSMIFRAQGGDKEFTPDNIPELQSMLIAGRPTGDVFGGITHEEIRQQSQALIDKLKPEDIQKIVEESGIEGEAKDRVLAGLLGRREFLVQQLSAQETKNTRPPRKRLREILQQIDTTEQDESKETGPRPRAEVICDHDHIENQRIDIIDRRDKEKIEIWFKLRPEITKQVLANLCVEEAHPDDKIKEGGILFESTSGEEFTMSDAYQFCSNGLNVSVANPINARAAIGLVKIEVPIDMPPEEVEKTINDIMNKDLGVNDGLSEVSAEFEQSYKTACYAWHHKINLEHITQEDREASERLTREEVYPGYSAMVDEGKAQEYQDKYGDIVPMHYLGTDDSERIYRVLTDGLMSSTERYKRGIFFNGLSTKSDFISGGADSVFVRSFRQNDISQNLSSHGACVVFNREIYNRTDWYSYSEDRYGSTESDTFSHRLSPDETFNAISNPSTYGYYTGTNEQMFRTGIGANYIDTIFVPNPAKTIAELHQMGLHDVNGRKIEEIIIKSPNSDATDYSAKPTENLESHPEIQKSANESAGAAYLAEKQAEKQAILDGNITDVTFSKIINGFTAKDVPLLIQAVIDHGGKDALVESASKTLLTDSSGVYDMIYPIGPYASMLKSVLENQLGFDLQKTYEELVKKESSAFIESLTKPLDSIPNTKKASPLDTWLDGLKTIIGAKK